MLSFNAGYFVYKFAIQKYKLNIHRIVILPVVLYGCETWYLILRNEHILMVFENRVLWKTFGPKMGDITGDWVGRNNESFYDLYSSPNIIRLIKSRMRCKGYVTRIGDRRGTLRV